MKANRYSPFPDRVEDRLSRTLTALNSELKMATLLAFDDHVYTKEHLAGRVRSVVGRGVQLPGPKIYKTYCDDSFCPAGAVSASYDASPNNRGEQSFFELTPAGRRFLQPIAAYTIDVSAKQGFSWYSILGPISSKGETNAPYNRFRLLTTLAQSSHKITDLEEILGLPVSGIIVHLERLQEQGLVTYESLGELKKGKGGIIYEWIAGASQEVPLTFTDLPTLTPKVIDALRSMGRGDAKTLADSVQYKSPNVVSRILCRLEEGGFVQRERWKGKSFRTACSITEKGRTLVDNHLYAIEDALSEGPALSKMQQDWEVKQANADVFQPTLIQGLGNYFSVSPYKTSRPRAESSRELLEYLQAHPGARPCEIEEKTSISVKSVVFPMLTAGLIRKEKEGRETRYYLNNTTTK